MEINSILPPTFVLCALPWDGAAVGGGGLQLWDGHRDPQTAQNPRAQRGWGCGDADTEGCARISAWQWGGDAWGAGCDPGAVSSPRPAVLRGQTVLRKHRSCALRPGSSSGSGGGGGGGAAPSPLRRPRAVAARRFPSLPPQELFAPQLPGMLREPRTPRWSFSGERREPGSHGDAPRARGGAGRAPHGHPRPLPSATRLLPHRGLPPRPHRLQHPQPRARPVLASYDRRHPRTAPGLSRGARGVPRRRPPLPPPPTPSTQTAHAAPRQPSAYSSSAPSCPGLSALTGNPFLPAPTLSWKVKRWEGPKPRRGLQILTERWSSCSLLRINGKEVCGGSVPERAEEQGLCAPPWGSELPKGRAGAVPPSPGTASLFCVSQTESTTQRRGGPGTPALPPPRGWGLVTDSAGQLTAALLLTGCCAHSGAMG